MLWVGCKQSLYYQLLDALGPDKAGKVAMTNFLSLLPG